MITVSSPTGHNVRFPIGISSADIAKQLGLKGCLVARFGGQLVDIHRALTTAGTVELLDWTSPEGKQVFWHSTSHLMAEALTMLYPGIKFGVGPPIENGFYYDVDFGDHTFSSDALDAVAKKMRALAKKATPYLREEVSKIDAQAYFENKSEHYKLALLEGLKDGEITCYTQGTFTDLCKGPHLPHTGHIKAIKLLKVAGAYWQGDATNQQLTRIYGVSFPDKEGLALHLAHLEKALKRDHRRIGQAMELFTFSAAVGAGLPLWLPKGAILREQLENFLKKVQEEAGYQPVITPHIGTKQLYITSGHYEKYGKDAFQPIETPQQETFLLKPMNCPHHCEIYRSRPRSHKELPLRLSEFGTVYRYEQSGELHGLTRVRGFTQDDAHIFCTPEQVKKEFINVITLVQHVFEHLNFTDYQVQLSLRDPQQPNRYIGKSEDWDKAERDIQEAVNEKSLSAVIVEGEAAFYGPKLDFMLKDALQRSWQLGTIQLDYQLPERFGLTYIGADNKKHQPVMLHRAPFGSMERLIALLIEHYGGDFPLWLAPVQVAVLPISDQVMPYVEQIAKDLHVAGIRYHTDKRNEKISRKIRDSELQKIPLMLLIGQKEAENNSLSLRVRQEGHVGEMSTASFLDFFNKKLKNINN